MKALMGLIAVIGVVLFALHLVLARRGADSKLKGKESPTARSPLTEREQSMFFRLRDALPDHVVLAQVAFSSLVTAKSHGARNAFNRKVADFVVCSKAFEVVAVIELDDASHRGKASHDAQRDAMLKAAGYRVLRYANVPNASTVQQDIASTGVRPAVVQALEPSIESARPPGRRGPSARAAGSGSSRAA